MRRCSRQVAQLVRPSQSGRRTGLVVGFNRGISFVSRSYRRTRPHPPGPVTIRLPGAGHPPHNQAGKGEARTLLK